MIHLNDYEIHLRDIVAIRTIEDYLEIELEDQSTVQLKATEEETNELCRRFLKHEISDN